MNCLFCLFFQGISQPDWDDFLHTLGMVMTIQFSIYRTSSSTVSWICFPLYYLRFAFARLWSIIWYDICILRCYLKCTWSFPKDRTIFCILRSRGMDLFQANITSKAPDVRTLFSTIDYFTQENIAIRSGSPEVIFNTILGRKKVSWGTTTHDLGLVLCMLHAYHAYEDHPQEPEVAV